MNWKSVLFTLAVFNFNCSFSQNNRLNVKNAIGWYNFFSTTKLNDRYSIHAEFQWRRDEYIANSQQNLLRIGLNYKISNSVLVRLGYAWIETFPYGEISLNSMNKDFTEHRIFQMIQLNHRETIVDFSHRFMFEQRFIGQYSAPELSKEDSYLFLNRLRYMFRAQMPLRGKNLEDNTPYIAAYNEVFLGFGSNIGENIFDQNRLGLMLGYQFNKSLRMEAGYLNQVLQYGREINGSNVFQKNNGFIINTYFNF